MLNLAIQLRIVNSQVAGGNMKIVYRIVSYALYVVALLLFLTSRSSVWRQTHWAGNDPRLSYRMGPSIADAQVAKIVSDAKQAAFIGVPQVGYSYTPKQHLEHTRQLMILEKELDWDYHTCIDTTGYCTRQLEETKVVQARITSAREELDRIFENGVDQNKQFYNYYAKTWKVEYEEAKAADSVLRQYDGYQTQVSNWDFGPLLWYHFQMYLWTLVLAFMMYWSMALAKNIPLGQFLLLIDQTALLFLVWPVMFWKIERLNPKAIARMAMRRLAVMVSFFFTLAPGAAFAQGKKAEKKASTDYALVAEVEDTPAAASDPPVNSFGVSVEAVNKYQGLAVGEIFADEPAPRIAGRYARTIPKGSIFASSWNSLGHGYNNESDLGVGLQSSGFGVSFTHMFVRGGDVDSISVGKSGKVGRLVPLGINLFHFFGTSKTSPPGGTVLKVSTSAGHHVGPVQVQHRFAASADNNPFGLGKGVSGIGFYTIEASIKRWYAAWNASVPILGRENTTRGFRQSVAVGYRQSFVW
jgi:hypothetical protein